MSDLIVSFVKDKALEIIISVIGFFLTSLATFMYKKTKNSGYFKYKKAKKRICEAEVVTFYYNRKVLQSDAGTIGDYIKKSKKNLVYVGFWLSSSLGAQNLSKAVREALSEGVIMEFCLLSPNAQVVKFYESYFSMSSDEIVARINHTIEQLKQIKDELPLNMRRQLKIYVHDEIITSSFWAIDREDYSNCLIQVDHKIIQNTRFSSYGFEIERTSAENELASALIDGYLSVIAKSKEILI